MNETEQFAGERFARITERLKSRPHSALRDFERDGAIERLQRNWNAPQRHLARKDFDNQQWIDRLETLKGKLGAGCILGFIGIRGPGKTQIAVELMRHQTEQRMKSARFTEAMEVFCSLRETYSSDSSKNERAAIAEWVRPELLVIDEAQERAETDFENRILTHIINKRYNAMTDTILISNLSKEPFLKSLGPSIEDRITETGGIVTFDWESFR